jgi:nucleoside-diphosphate kinase
MIERTFIMVKPDHYDLADLILKDLDMHGNRVQTARVESVPREVIEEHYAAHRGKYYFGYMTDSFVGRPVVLAVYEGEGIIKKMMDAVGPTDPAKAEGNTIRRKYCNDSLDAAIAEKRPCKNAVHRSDSPKEAERELAVWAEFLKVA